jgi:hypothetical protein
VILPRPRAGRAFTLDGQFKVAMGFTTYVLPRARRTCELGFECVVSKREGSFYRSGKRAHRWLRCLSTCGADHATSAHTMAMLTAQTMATLAGPLVKRFMLSPDLRVLGAERVALRRRERRTRYAVRANLLLFQAIPRSAARAQTSASFGRRPLFGDPRAALYRARGKDRTFKSGSVTRGPLHITCVTPLPLTVIFSPRGQTIVGQQSKSNTRTTIGRNTYELKSNQRLDLRTPCQALWLMLWPVRRRDVGSVMPCLAVDT